METTFIQQLPNLIRQTEKSYDGENYKPSSYSGRGMYGEYCLSVSVEDIDGFWADFLESVPAKYTGDVAKLMRSQRTDNMGRRYVVYFPSVPFEEEGDED